MLAVVLTAGRGSRLGHLTVDRSKAMMPIAGQPMVGCVLRMLVRGGVDSAVVVAHPSDAALVEYLRTSSRAPMVRLAFQKDRLGMAHAVECASPLVRETGAAEFLLAACDSLYPQGHVARLVAHRREARLDAALTLMWTARDRAPAGAVALLQYGSVRDIIEKPDLDEIPVNEGRQEALSVPSLYALSSRLLGYVPQVPFSARGEREFPDALRLLIADGGRVDGRLVPTRRSLTRPSDLLELNREILRADPSRGVVQQRLPADTRVEPPVRIEEQASVAPGCQLSPETYLEGGCRVESGAVVRRSVVMRGGRVKAREVVVDSVISSVGQVS